jgi:hypothetical protein
MNKALRNIAAKITQGVLRAQTSSNWNEYTWPTDSEMNVNAILVQLTDATYKVLVTVIRETKLQKEKL